MANPPAGQASAWTSRLTRSSTPIQDRGPWVGRGKCSAGACPPPWADWGGETSGWGTRPQPMQGWATPAPRCYRYANRGSAGKCSAGACPQPLRMYRPAPSHNATVGAPPPWADWGGETPSTIPQPTDNPRGVIIGVQMFVTSNASLYRRGRPQMQDIVIAKQNPARRSRPERRLDSGRQSLSNRAGSNAKH